MFKAQLIVLVVFLSASSQSQAASSMSDNLDLMWVILAGILVFIMQAGFALLESGMARAKNAVNVMMKNYTDVCIATVVFWFIGYNLMFGDNPSGYMGMLTMGIADDSAMGQALLFFQIMFAATAATICSGAMAERVRFPAYLISAALLVAITYPIYGSWVWNSQGWLAKLGFIDFAGSTVVHSIGAWCALSGVLVLGPRLGRFSSRSGETREIPGHNLTMIGLGGFLLWFGWFGFNAGSTLELNSSIAEIALNTHLAASAGVLGATLTYVVLRQPIMMTGIVNGSLAGLVSITAGCATMSGGWAMLTGLIGGIICITSGKLLLRLKIDDVVGAIPVHGFAGAWGTLAAGMFIKDDLFNQHQIMVQLTGIGAAFIWALGTSYCIFVLIDKLMGLRSSSQHEQRGLDFTEHAESAFPEFQMNVTHKQQP